MRQRRERIDHKWGTWLIVISGNRHECIAEVKGRLLPKAKAANSLTIGSLDATAKGLHTGGRTRVKMSVVDDQHAWTTKQFVRGLWPAWQEADRNLLCPCVIRILQELSENGEAILIGIPFQIVTQLFNDVFGLNPHGLPVLPMICV